ncbi:MAG: V-type ATP synthase subunit F [Candidatus Thermoplasmatota archaeon]|nr:V-type ATP synthase subunit F [Candidatus Thermoplasmatota archaeon]
MRMAVIGDEDTVALFKFAGVGKTIVANEDVEKKFDELVADEETAVIIITERIADKLMKKITKIKLQRELPIIVEIPDKKGKIEGRENSVEKIIRRAVGVEI